MFAVKVLCTLALVSLTLAYREPSPGRGGYSLPNIGKYPAPTPTFPGRDHGLPPVYHGKFKRSADDDFATAEGQAYLADDDELISDQAIRIPRSVEGLEQVVEFQEAEAIPELSRVRRDSRVIFRPLPPPPRRKVYYRF